MQAAGRWHYRRCPCFRFDLTRMGKRKKDVRKKSLTHPKMQSTQRLPTHRPVIGICGTYVSEPSTAIPSVVNGAQHVPISVGSPFTSAAAAVRVGRARGSMDDGEYGLTHNDCGDVYGRRSGRLASKGSRHGVRTPKCERYRFRTYRFMLDTCE